MDRRTWTASEMNHLEKLVGHVSSATIAKRLHRLESSVVNKLKRIGTSRRVRNGYTMRELELCLGEDHHKITLWIQERLVAGPFAGHTAPRWKWQRHPSHPRERYPYLHSKLPARNQPRQGGPDLVLGPCVAEWGFRGKMITDS